MSNFETRVREHPLEGLVFQHAVEPAQHLRLGVGELLAVELGLEEPARRALELVDMCAVFVGAAGFHQLAQRVDRGIRDVEHQPGDIAEDDALLGGHARRQQRAQHEVIELDDRIGQPFAFQSVIGFQPVLADREQVQADRPVDVLGIDQHDPLRRQGLGLQDRVDQIALAVDHHDRLVAARHRRRDPWR